MLSEIPRADDAKFRAPAREQTLCALVDDIQIMLVACEAVTLPEAAIEHEAEVVGVGKLLGGFHAPGKAFCEVTELLVASVLVYHP